MKKCTQCNEEKDISLFSKSKRSKDGKRSECKDCNKKYRDFKSKTNNAEYRKSYYLLNKDKIIKNNKTYSIINQDQIREKRKKYRDENKDRIKLRSSIYYLSNKEKLNEKSKKYSKENRLHLNEKSRLRIIERKNKDNLFKLSCNIRRLIQLSFKSKIVSKNTKTECILGCDTLFFKKYLESKFEKWMSWENYGLFNNEFCYGWDIDHIKPVSLASSEEELIKLNHYTNLQPLCSKYNRQIKKDNYE